MNLQKTYLYKFAVYTILKTTFLFVLNFLKWLLKSIHYLIL